MRPGRRARQPLRQGPRRSGAARTGPCRACYNGRSVLGRNGPHRRGTHRPGCSPRGPPCPCIGAQRRPSDGPSSRSPSRPPPAHRPGSPAPPPRRRAPRLAARRRPSGSAREIPASATAGPDPPAPPSSCPSCDRSPTEDRPETPLPFHEADDAGTPGPDGLSMNKAPVPIPQASQITPQRSFRPSSERAKRNESPFAKTRNYSTRPWTHKRVARA